MATKQGNSKQKLLLEYLISSVDTFALCKSIVKSDYFTPEYRKVVSFIHDYYDTYNTTPSTDQVEAETDVTLKLQEVTRDQVEYCANEVEKFCRQKAINDAIVSASALMDKEENYGNIEQLIRDAISVSLNRDLGTQYFDNPLARLEESAKTPQRVSTGWRDVDALLGGGLARTEILLLSANSGGGKSITLANLAVNVVEQGLNVLYLTLELSEEMVSQRFDTMFTGISSVNWIPHMYDIANTVETIGKRAGRLTVKRMPSGTNANSIRSYIKEYELKLGIIPDLLVVDYLDMMGTNQRVSADNVWEKDKQATEQLRDILFDYNMFCATASQQNRAAIDATASGELNQGHIAGGITKVNTVDWYISIVMTPTMKAAGEMMFIFLKSRSSDAVGKHVTLKWVNNSLRVVDADRTDKDDDPILQKIANEGKEPTKKRTLTDIMEF